VEKGCGKVDTPVIALLEVAPMAIKPILNTGNVVRKVTYKQTANQGKRQQWEG